jgi:potassium-dependent mechanosensitive channel
MCDRIQNLGARLGAFSARSCRFRSSCALAVLLLIGFAIGPSSARVTNSSPATEEPLVAELEERLAQTKALLSEAEASDQAPLSAGVTEQDRVTRRFLLQQLVRTYQSHLFFLAEIDSAKARRDERTREMKSWRGFSGGPPYSLLLIDSLREAVNAQDLQLKATGAKKQFVQASADNQRGALNSHEKNIRRLNESLESATDPTARERTKVALDLEKLQSQVASAGLASIQAEGRLADDESLEASEYRDFARSQISLAGNQIVFPQADLDRVLTQVDQEIAQKEAQYSALSSSVSGKEMEIRQARAQLENAELNQTAPPELRVLREAFNLRGDQLETLHSQIALQQLVVEGLRQAQNIYRFRFVLASSADLPGIREASLRMDESIRKLGWLRSYLNTLNDLNRSLLIEQQSRLHTLDSSSPLAPLILERIASYRERLDIVNRVINGVERENRLVSRWSETIADSQRHLSFLERLQLTFRNTQDLAERLWNFELYNAIDTIVVDGQKVTGRRSVTVGKVVQIVLILVLGFFMCRLLAAVVRRVAKARFKVQDNASRILGKWIFGVLLAILVVFSLILVKIPFEAFAFLGGALAIGVGFGMQNLLKNLISGMIILIERPMRLGDIVEISGTRGEVTNIGVRSSVIRRKDGVELLVPNSTFLENSVTNLTYSSKNLQSTLSVGVAYDVSVRKVSQLLIQIAGAHGMVLKKPPPAAMLTEFAERGLVFTLTYWINITEADPATVASDLRQMIVHQAAENGIALSNVPVEPKPPGVPPAQSSVSKPELEPSRKE